MDSGDVTEAYGGEGHDAEVVEGLAARHAAVVAAIAAGLAKGLDLVAAVVTLTALGEGARRYVVGQFAAIGTNLVIVVPGKTETTGGMPGMGGAPNDLTLDDARALLRGVPEIDKALPTVVASRE